MHHIHCSHSSRYIHSWKIEKTKKMSKTSRALALHIVQLTFSLFTILSLLPFTFKVLSIFLQNYSSMKLVRALYWECGLISWMKICGGTKSLRNVLWGLKLNVGICRGTIYLFNPFLYSILTITFFIFLSLLLNKR